MTKDASGPSGAHLLDTDTISALLRDPLGAVATRIDEVGDDLVFTSAVVAGELRYGAARSGSRQLAERVDGVLGSMSVVGLSPDAAHHYADIRAVLTRAGTPIGPNDLWIAAHARSLGAILVTGNEREFRRVPELEVENWLDR